MIVQNLAKTQSPIKCDRARAIFDDLALFSGLQRDRKTDIYAILNASGISPLSIQ